MESTVISASEPVHAEEYISLPDASVESEFLTRELVDISYENSECEPLVLLKQN